MSVTRTFTLRGDFVDRITQPLQNINQVLEEQLRIQRSLIRVNEQVTRAQRQTTAGAERSSRAMFNSAEAWQRFREEMTQAEIAAQSIEKISTGFIDGISNAFEKMVGAGQKSIGFVKDRFKEAMDDQINDIQAAGSVFGALTSAGLIDDSGAGYKRAKGIYKQLDTAIGEAVKSSTAPTDTIIGFSRTLTDNILPELIKDDVASGMSLEDATRPAADQMAQMYEQMALMTPKGYSPQMVSKSVQKMLQGESLNKLAIYDFFQMNPVLLDQLEKQGLETVDTVKERLEVFKKALAVSLSPQAIAEMRNSVSGGIQALQDTFLNPTVGIFSFARAFNWRTGKAGPGEKSSGGMVDWTFRRDLMEQTLKGMQMDGPARLNLNGMSIDEYVDEMDTPLKIIGSTLGPFLQDLANLFGTAGPVMGHVAKLFNIHVGPILRKLAFNARVMQMDVESGKHTISYAIGRMLAEIVKGITELFQPGGAADEVSGLLGGVIEEFKEGFESLDHTVDWQKVINEIMDAIKNTLLASGIREVLAAIFIALAAPSIIGGIFSAITMSLMVPISAWMTTVAGPAIAAFFAPVVTAITGILATVFSPIGILVGILAAMIALVITALIRYRDSLGKIIKNSFEAIILRIKNELYLKVKARWQSILASITDFLAGFVNLVRKLPGQGDFGQSVVDAQERLHGELDDTKEKIKVNEQKQVEAAMRVKDGFTELGQAVSKDFAAMSNVVKNQIGSLGTSIKNGLESVGKIFNKGVNYIDNLGGGIKSTTKKAEAISKAGDVTSKAAQAGTEATKTGTEKVLGAIGRAISAISSIGSGGGGAGGGGVAVGGDAISKGIAASQKFNGVANRCAAIVKAYLEANGQDASGMTLMAESSKNMGTVMTDWSKLQAGDLIGWSGGPGHGDEHVGVYTGGNNVFHQSSTRDLKAGNYPDLDYFKKQRGAYFVRMNFDGFIPDMFRGILNAVDMESKMMPSKANVVVANDSETILTKQQATAVNNVLSDYNGRQANTTQRSINVCIKTLDPTSISEEVAKRIGQAISRGFDSAVTDAIQTVTLGSY